MKLNKVLAAVAVASAAMVGAPAHAVFITGSVSFTGGFELPAAFTNLQTSMTSLLTSFNVDQTVGVGRFNSATPVLGGGVTGLPTFGDATTNDFSVLSAPQVLFLANGFTFTVTNFGPLTSSPMSCPALQCTDARGFNNAIGTVSKAGFDTTGFTMAWSAQGTCNKAVGSNTCVAGSATGSWSASVSSTGTVPVGLPEPASLALAGLALAGIALTRKAKRA